MDEFPLPHIDNTHHQLAGVEFFTTLDMPSGYRQVEMSPQDQEKTAFRTYSGLFEFRKMPVSPGTFQRLMEVVLADLVGSASLVYLDDVLIVGRTVEEHKQNLCKVLNKIRAAGLRLKPKKCLFVKLQVEYLGHVVSAMGIETDPKKIEDIQEYPIPVNVKEIHCFVGLASYYKWFIRHFARIASPLHTLTKKDVALVWTPECQSAFENLKRILTTAHPCFPTVSPPFSLGN